MRLTRIDLVPVLTIVAGGVLGASLSFSFLGSRSADVTVTVPVVSPSDAMSRAVIQVQRPATVVPAWSQSRIIGELLDNVRREAERLVDSDVLDQEKELRASELMDRVERDTRAGLWSERVRLGEALRSEEQKARARARALRVGTLRWSSEVDILPDFTIDSDLTIRPNR